MWQVLMERPDKRVALLWNGLDNLIKEQLQLVLDTLEVLRDLVEITQSQELTASTHRVLIRTVLFGGRSSFPKWS